MIFGGNITNCSFNFCFNQTEADFTELLQGIDNLNNNFVLSSLTEIVVDRKFLLNLQSSFAEPPSLG